jgi:oligopeptide transport system ATP-binding protein
MNLCEIKNLCVDFKVKGFGKSEVLSAVRNVSLGIRKGEIFALVGESGCGKTTVANAVLGFCPISSGEIEFNGFKLNKDTDKKTWTAARRGMQAVFQDPFTSLNPRFDVRTILAEPLVLRGEYNGDAVLKRIIERVGMREADLSRDVFEFSGGQRQRIAVARALVANPDLIVCDEPTSALDISVHSQICNLLLDLQEEYKITYLFISHNLGLVKHISKHMAVMYSGQIVESGGTEKIFENPTHPYTKALLSAIIETKPSDKERIILKGEVASPINAPDTCRFYSRCGSACGACLERVQELKEIEKDHFCACQRV